MEVKGYNKGLVFAAACIGMLLFGIVMISLGSILPEVTDKFKLNDAKTGLLLTLLPSGILAGSLVFGPLVDWLSYKRILITGSLLTFVGLEGIVFSNAATLLHLSVFAIGMGGGILNGLTNALVSEISETNHAANLSLLGVFFGVGALGTPVLLGLLKDVYPFEVVFGSIGVFVLLATVFFTVIAFPKSAQAMGFPLKDGLAMLKDTTLLLFGLLLFFQSGIEGLTNNWTTTYLEKIKEVESSQALFILSSFVAGITLARLMLGKFLRVFDPFKVTAIGLVGALLGCIIVLYGSTEISLITGMSIIGFGIAAVFPVILGYIGQLYTKLAGTAFSIAITIALLGNVLANYFMGQVSQHYGVKVLPYFMTAFIVAVLLLLFTVKNRYHLKTNKI
ncbi:MFS transporter [Flagellimonas myxillae]|uniref:MFS transporter n=1 Tax=Flagellimonas myxillae TaxID=2942214 RepID=UPI00201E8E8B|nr:MFS transporter [Muricauda myxillae]MCL6268072.1 MFS transporter [Muricauda myxillae]